MSSPSSLRSGPHSTREQPAAAQVSLSSSPIQCNLLFLFGFVMMTTNDGYAVCRNIYAVSMNCSKQGCLSFIKIYTGKACSRCFRWPVSEYCPYYLLIYVERICMYIWIFVLHTCSSKCLRGSLTCSLKAYWRKDKYSFGFGSQVQCTMHADRKKSYLLLALDKEVLVHIMSVFKSLPLHK